MNIFTGDNGKGSLKKTTTFIYALLGVCMVIADQIARHGVLNYDAFLIVISMAGGMSILSTVSTKIKDAIQPEPGQDTTKTEINIKQETAGS